MNGFIASTAGAAPGLYVGWGSFVIQVGNLIVILLMIVLFVLALFVPFPRPREPK